MTALIKTTELSQREGNLIEHYAFQLDSNENMLFQEEGNEPGNILEHNRSKELWYRGQNYLIGWELRECKIYKLNNIGGTEQECLRRS